MKHPHQFVDAVLDFDPEPTGRPVPSRPLGAPVPPPTEGPPPTQGPGPTAAAEPPTR